MDAPRLTRVNEITEHNERIEDLNELKKGKDLSKHNKIVS